MMLVGLSDLGDNVGWVAWVVVHLRSRQSRKGEQHHHHQEHHHCCHINVIILVIITAIVIITIMNIIIAIINYSPQLMR